MALAVSPAEDGIVIALQGTLFRLPASGGRAEAITGQLFDASEPAWSPDGSTIVFQGYRHGNWDLWTTPANGRGAPQALTRDAFDDRQPQFSPDGRSVIFASDRGGNYDIWRLSVPDRELRQVTSAPADEHSPALSPDGERLAYVASVDPQRDELRVRWLSSGAEKTLASDARAMSGVSWARDGRRLSYVVAPRSPVGKMETQLIRIDLADGASAPLSQPGSDVFPFPAAWTRSGLFYAADGQIRRWTPTGEHVVPFEASFMAEPRRLVHRRLDSGDGRQRALGLASPALSPDGRRVAFSALGDLWLWDASRRQLEQITDDPAADQMPGWSPDGRHLAYVSDKQRPGTLWIYHVADRTFEPIELSARGLAYPAWSPDGRSIAAFAEIPGDPLASQLILIDLATRTTRALYKPLPAQPIRWTSDGRLLTSALTTYSRRYREGVHQPILIDPETGQLVARIVPEPHRNIVDPALAPDGASLTYVADGLLWRVRLGPGWSAAGKPVPLTRELTDNPAWSAAGTHVVYLSGDRMRLLPAGGGRPRDITPRLHWTADRPGDQWILRAGRLFDPRAGRYREKVDILVAGNRIQRVGPWDPKTRLAVVDASARTVIPGLFEMHAHMGTASETLGRAWLAYGVTSVRDPGSSPYVAKERQEMWASGRSLGPRAFLAGPLLDGGRVFYSISESIVTPAHLERAFQRARALRLDFVKTYVRLPPDLQKHAVRLAHELHMPLTSHELYPAAAFGADQVEHIGGTSRRGYSVKVSSIGRSYADVADLLSGSGMAVTPTAVLPGIVTLFGTDTDLFAAPKFKSLFADRLGMYARFFSGDVQAYVRANEPLLRTLAERGVPMGTGTDGPFLPSGAGVHAELRLLVRAGLSPAQALRAATHDAASMVGVGSDLGTIEAGRLADMVVVDGDPLTDIRDAAKVVMTIKNGRRLPIDRLLSDDIAGAGTIHSTREEQP